jgi:hypothetical protein
MIYPAEDSKTVALPIVPSVAIKVKLGVANA